MNRAQRTLIISGLLLAAFVPGWTQDRPERKGAWAGIEAGYGTLDRSADRERHDRQGAFGLAFSVGGTLNRYVRIGAKVNGWLLEPYSLDDSGNGESVSQILAIVQVYPWPARDLFLTAGAGRAIYTNNDSFASDGSGWGGTIGAGYEWPLPGKMTLGPVFNYSRGHPGRVETRTGGTRSLDYNVFDFGIALTYP